MFCSRGIAGLVLSVGIALGILGWPAAGPARAAAAPLRICGEVTAYVAPSLLGTGLLTVGAVPLVVAPGVSLPAGVAVGADLCFELSTDLLGTVTGATVTPNVTTTVRLCGRITSVAAATATATGLLRVGGRSFTLAAASSLPAIVTAGADLCLGLTLNAFGEVQGGTAVVNTHATAGVCGQVAAYTAPTATADGRLTIAGRTYAVAAGASVDPRVRTGVFARLSLTIDGFGRVSNASVVSVGATLAAACGGAVVPILPPAFPSSSPASTGSPTPPGPSAPPSSPTLPPKPPAPAAVASAMPTASASPSSSISPSPSPTPAATARPSASSSPPAELVASAASAAPRTSPPTVFAAGVAGVEETCEPLPPTAATTLAEALPDTASVTRTAGVVAANAVPLVGIGLGSLLSGWLLSSRRRQDDQAGDALLRMDP